MARLKRKRSASWDDGANPMDGVSNLSDAMLVFACGLMIAIAVNWNVDLKVQKVDMEPEKIVESSDIENIVSDSEDDNTYREMGKVYMNPEDGTMYMVTDK